LNSELFVNFSGLIVIVLARGSVGEHGIDGFAVNGGWVASLVGHSDVHHDSEKAESEAKEDDNCDSNKCGAAIDLFNGGVTVFPNHVGRFSGTHKFQILAQELLLIRSNRVQKLFVDFTVSRFVGVVEHGAFKSLLSFKSDEGSNGALEFVSILSVHLVDLLVDLGELVKSALGDEGSTGDKSLEQLLVVEGKTDVGNSDVTLVFENLGELVELALHFVFQVLSKGNNWLAHFGH